MIIALFTGRLKFAAPIMLGFFLSSLLIYFFGVHLFYWDEWDLLSLFEAYHQGAPLWGKLWEPHNEHRLVLTRLTYLFLYEMGWWDLRIMMAMGQALLWCSFAFVMYWSYQSGHDASQSHTMQQDDAWSPHNILPGVIFVCFLFYLSPAHHTNQFWAFQLQWYFVWIGMMISTFVFSHSTIKPKHFLLGILGASLAYFGTSAGVVVLVHIFLLLLIRSIEKHYYWKGVLTWGVLSTIAITLYFQEHPIQSSDSMAFFKADPLSYFQYGLTLIGSLIGADDTVTATGVGALGLLYTLYLTIRHRKDMVSHHFFAYGLIQFGLLFSVIVTWGRAKHGVEQALSSHYSLMTMSFWVGVLLLSRNHLKTRQRAIIIMVILFFVTINKKNFDWIREHANRNRGKRCYEHVLNSPEKITPRTKPYSDCKFLYPDRHVVYERIPLFAKLNITF